MRTYVVVLLAVACLGLSACGSDDASHDVVPAIAAGAHAAAGRRGARPDLDGHVEHVGLDTTSTDQTGHDVRPDQTQTQAPRRAPRRGQPDAAGSPRRRDVHGHRRQPAGGTGGTGTGTGSGGTGGVSPGEFSQFCKDNPGAC